MGEGVKRERKTERYHLSGLSDFPVIFKLLKKMGGKRLAKIAGKLVAN